MNPINILLILTEIALLLMASHKTSAARFNSLIKHQDEKWDIYWQSLKQNIPGTEEDKQVTLRKRVIKFFKGFKVGQKTHYNERRDIICEKNACYDICPNILMLYGIDYLSIEKIKNYFGRYECEVQMIDYSHCLVRFLGGTGILIKALYQNLIEKPSSLQQMLDYFSKQKHQLTNWREIKGYQELCFQRKLWTRFSLVDQKNGVSSIRQTKDIDSYNQAKADFLKKMQGAMKKKKLNNNFNKNCEEKGSKCPCQKKLNQLIDILGCKAKSGREWSIQRQRSRSRDYKGRNKKQYRIKVLPDYEPLNIIKEITEPKERPSFSQKEKKRQKNTESRNRQKPTHNSSFISAIGRQEEQEEDELYREMLTSMQRFGNINENDKNSSANVSMISKKSDSLFSMYEEWSESDQQ